MNKIYVLSYISNKAYKRHLASKSFEVPIRGFYRGHKIESCKICCIGPEIQFESSNLEKIAIMDISLISVEKNKILGKLNRLNFF